MLWKHGFLDRVTCININNIDSYYESFTKIDINVKVTEIFNHLGKFKEILDITLMDDAKPFIQSVLITIPIPFYESVKHLLMLVF